MSRKAVEIVYQGGVFIRIHFISFNRETSVPSIESRPPSQWALTTTIAAGFSAVWMCFPILTRLRKAGRCRSENRLVKDWASGVYFIVKHEARAAMTQKVDWGSFHHSRRRGEDYKRENCWWGPGARSEAIRDRRSAREGLRGVGFKGLT
jgi:hypothetical protein